ncbi:TonB-dependent receptor [Phyllobacterium endophyticum]|nr:TonB-dependent receptor [Phyllobacterium endophyticum]
MCRAMSRRPSGNTRGMLAGCVSMVFASLPAVAQERDGSSIPFSISVDGEPLAKGGTLRQGPTKAAAAAIGNQRRKTDVGLAAVDIQVKFDGLDVSPMLNISTIPVRRAYLPGETIDFLATANYPAFIRNAEIRIFEDSEEVAGKPVVIVPIAVNGEASWTMPAKEEKEKRFKYVLRVYDADRRYDETLPRTLARTSSELPQQETNTGRVGADEGTVTAPGMGEDYTALRNIPVHGGAVTIFGRHVPEGYLVKALGDTIPVDREHAFVVQRILPAGNHEVDVAVSGISKSGGLAFSRRITIPRNEWFYVGLADLTVGKRFGDDNIETVRPGEYDDVYARGRLAFYVKGKIKGKYLLTAAGDSAEDDLDNMFRGLDAKDPRNLLRRIDPDDFYPLYGDDSTAIDDARTNGKFYVRLDRGDSHVMWGNYKASITGNEFMRSDRALYGASGVYRSEKTTTFGERQTEATVYAAEPATLPQRDEFLGTGGSAYFMKRQDITIGSETVSVEVRDQVTGQVMERRTLRYGEDYSFDYLQGTLILKRPLSSSIGTAAPVREGALGGNKLYLISQYEFTPTAGTIDGYVYGGRVQHWFADKLRIGATGMNENTGLANQQAYGADIQIRHSEQTFIEAEVARSKGPGFGTSRSTDGGLTLSDVGTTGTRNRAATSWRAKAQVDLEDIAADGFSGIVGSYYEQKNAGFSTISEQVSVDERLWGAFANIELSKALNLDLNYDDYHEGSGRSDIDDREIGRRSKRKGAGAVSWQLNEYWKASFGLTYSALQSPIARATRKSGYNGSRLDTGARLEYQPDDDHTYYLFGQATLSRAGDINRNDRAGAGTVYELTEKISLSGEVSYGNQGFGGLAGIDYHPTADDSYYLGYRLDPDRSFGLDRSYDLVGTDRGTLVLGAKRKLNDTLSAYAERNYDLFGARNSLTQTYGVVYTPDEAWTIDGGFEAGIVEDDTIDPDDGLENSDFERRAVSLAIGYKDEERITARLRGEARFENSDDDSRDANTYLVASGLSWKTSEDWRLLVNVEAVFSDSDRKTSFRDGDYTEASFGYAYRPIANDRLNALFKYAWLRDTPGEDQVSAISGDEYGPSQRSHILSADANYDLYPWLTIGGKYGFRIGETRQRQDDDREVFSGWEKSSAHLGILRADLTFVKSWDFLVEGRVLAMPDAGTTDYGALLALYRHVGDNFKVGVGYNFGQFSEDLRDLTLDDQGVFLNVVGKF